MELGEPFVLEVEDTSPFMTFGNVEPGQTISVMYNNMVRAPLFRHQVKSTDFLLIRSTHHGQSRYYLREIPAIFVMGQTYPVQEVPGPQSRRVTTTVKNRLQIVAYRLIAKHPQQRLKMSKLASRFPEYQDIQVRQRLKEFLEFNRHSKDKGGGYWKVRAPKGGVERRLPGEDQLRQMCTPEMVCLYESMLVGERHLLDLGYSNVNDDTADQDESNTSQLETEQQLAPWFATRNFINACQGKAMLKLSGEGDPTGCGEGFSFIRVSMKDIFLRAGESAEKKLGKIKGIGWNSYSYQFGHIAQIKSRPKSAHRYNVAEQQQVYREEVSRCNDNASTRLVH
jgi:transcription initiation factor TFIID subunit 1